MLLIICFVMNVLGFICSMSKSGFDECEDCVSASDPNTRSPREYCDKKWEKKTTVYSM